MRGAVGSSCPRGQCVDGRRGEVRRPKNPLFLMHRFHSIRFTRAQGIPLYKIGFRREKDAFQPSHHFPPRHASYSPTPCGLRTMHVIPKLDQAWGCMGCTVVPGNGEGGWTRHDDWQCDTHQHKIPVQRVLDGHQVRLHLVDADVGDDDEHYLPLPRRRHTQHTPEYVRSSGAYPRPGNPGFGRPAHKHPTLGHGWHEAARAHTIRLYNRE